MFAAIVLVDPTPASQYLFALANGAQGPLLLYFCAVRCDRGVSLASRLWSMFQSSYSNNGKRSEPSLSNRRHQPARGRGGGGGGGVGGVGHCSGGHSSGGVGGVGQFIFSTSEKTYSDLATPAIRLVIDNFPATGNQAVSVGCQDGNLEKLSQRVLVHAAPLSVVREPLSSGAARAGRLSLGGSNVHGRQDDEVKLRITFGRTRFDPLKDGSYGRRSYDLNDGNTGDLDS